MIDGARTSRTARSQDGKPDAAGAPSGADSSAGPLFAAGFADSPSRGSAPAVVPPADASGRGGRSVLESRCAESPPAACGGALGASPGGGGAGPQASPNTNKPEARQSLSIQVGSKPPQHALPGRACRVGVVPRARVVKEAMLGARVDL